MSFIDRPLAAAGALLCVVAVAAPGLAQSPSSSARARRLTRRLLRPARAIGVRAPRRCA